MLKFLLDTWIASYLYENFCVSELTLFLPGIQKPGAADELEDNSRVRMAEKDGRVLHVGWTHSLSCRLGLLQHCFS